MEPESIPSPQNFGAAIKQGRLFNVTCPFILKYVAPDCVRGLGSGHWTTGIGLTVPEIDSPTLRQHKLGRRKGTSEAAASFTSVVDVRTHFTPQASDRELGERREPAHLIHAGCCIPHVDIRLGSLMPLSHEKQDVFSYRRT